VVLAVAVFGCTDTGPVDDTAQTQTTVSSATTPPTFDLTDFSMDQIADGPPLDWTLALADEGLQPVGAVHSGDKTYIFANEDGRGLRGWMSADTTTWDEVAPIVSDDSQVALVGADDDSVVIVTRGRAGRRPEVLSSGDGVEWGMEEIPVDEDNGLVAFSPQAIVVSDGLIVVAGHSQIDAAAAVGSRIRDVLWPGYDPDRFELEWSQTGDSVVFMVLAPGGITVLTATAEELGIDVETLQWLREEPPPGATAWVWLDGGGWSRTTIDGAVSVDSMSMTDNGAIVAVGHTELDQLALWISFDGFLWEQVPYSVRPYELASFDGGLVGPAASGSFDLVTSEDGIEWSSSGLGNRFPSSQQWFAEAIHTSSDRIAVSAVHFDDSRSLRSFDLPWIEKDGVEILLEPFFGELRVIGEEGESRVWGRSDGVPDGLVFDPTTETIHLARQDGTEWAQLTLAELEDLSDRYYAAISPPELYDRAIALSEDGASWTIRDLASLGGNTQPTGIAITDTTIVLASTDHSTGTGLAVYTAPLP